MRIEVVLLFVLVDLIEPNEKIWKFDSDISNPANWIGGKLAENCKGIHFAPVNSAPVFIHGLTTKELILPSDGEIQLMEGSSIEFKDNYKCIQLKPMDYHDWYDDESWVRNGNVAIPDKERVPCDHDSVNFPKAIHTRVIENFGLTIETGSVKFGNEIFDQNKIDNLMDTSVGQTIFYNPIDPLTFHIKTKQCEDPQGCLCHQYDIPCPNREYHDKITCLNPISPEQFCHPVCGAYITFQPKHGFRLDDLKTKLNEYTVDTYASRLKDYLGNDVIQVVFREKEFNEKSLEEAQDFYQKLKNKQDRIENLQIQKSGRYHAEARVGASSALAVVFGTLVAAVVFFALLFYINGDTNIDTIIRRFRSGGRSGSLFNVPFFARFDNTDENLIIDSESVAGSSLTLAKAFDNPMYGKTSTSTEEEEIEESPNQHENPLYDVKLKKEEEDKDKKEEIEE